MKRSLEKSRSSTRSRAEDARTVIPCDADKVHMGGSYDVAPREWRTTTRTCVACKAGFVVSAGEQLFWYETLGIPFQVGIIFCPDCRRRQRAHRRIITGLSALVPLVDRGAANDRQLREAALLIAEGTVRRVADRCGTGTLVLGGQPILVKGAAMINRLREADPPQHDLLPIQLHFQQRLGHEQRALRLAAEIGQAKRDHQALAKAMRAVEAWLAAPTKRQFDRIIEPPRLRMDLP